MAVVVREMHQLSAAIWRRRPAAVRAAPASLRGAAAPRPRRIGSKGALPQTPSHIVSDAGMINLKGRGAAPARQPRRPVAMCQQDSRNIPIGPSSSWACPGRVRLVGSQPGQDGTGRQSRQEMSRSLSPPDPPDHPSRDPASGLGVKHTRAHPHSAAPSRSRRASDRGLVASRRQLPHAKPRALTGRSTSRRRRLPAAAAERISRDAFVPASAHGCADRPGVRPS